METLNDYLLIVIVLFLIWICYNLWQAGRYRDPGQENTYFSLTKKAPYCCPYDIDGRSCKSSNCPDGSINCRECDWYGKGVRPSKF